MCSKVVANSSRNSSRCNYKNTPHGRIFNFFFRADNNDESQSSVYPLPKRRRLFDVDD